ncbi:MAG: glycosyltransferase [Verrucomicrobiae bacterium]
MITIAICTYNRCGSLRTTLASFAACEVPAGLEWEMLLVDNASTDATPAVAREFDGALPLRYIFEPKQGLSHARNRAVAEASGSGLLLFTDDDILVERSWIEAYHAAASRHPEADFFGGRVIPHFSEGRPSWLLDERMDLLDGFYGCYDLGPEMREIIGGDILPIGGSMGFRQSCFSGSQRFRTDLGVIGRGMGRGEETEFLGRLVRDGKRGLYVARARCHHGVLPERLKFGCAFRYGLACGGGRGSLPRAALFVLRGIRQLLIGRGDRARQCAIRAGMEVRKASHFNAELIT